jgi:hypothetical protein
VTPGKLQDRITNQPKAWWQRTIAGEQLPNRLFHHPKCQGTVEDHRAIALDVRELIHKRVFDQPVGSVFRLNLRFPWLRMMRLNSSSLDLELVTGRTIIVPLVWASCGVMGERMRLECPLCGRRACSLYHLDGTVACRHCNNLWYAAQRISSTARKFLSKRKSAGSSVTMAKSRVQGSRRNRAGCGSGRMGDIVRRWNVSSASRVVDPTNQLRLMSANDLNLFSNSGSGCQGSPRSSLPGPLFSPR